MLNPTYGSPAGRDPNLDELVLYQLEGPHATSAAKNMKLLLEHVIQRLPVEGATLATDNAEKRLVLPRSQSKRARPSCGLGWTRYRAPVHTWLSRTSQMKRLHSGTWQSIPVSTFIGGWTSERTRSPSCWRRFDRN